MKPSATQILESINWSLEQKVVPQVEDKWAASTLRSIRCLLEHLSVRVESEGQMLFEDNADLRAALASAREQLVGCGGEWAVFVDRVDAALAAAWRAPGAYPTVASLNEENEALQGVLDDLLRRLYRDESGLEPAARQALLAAAEACVDRRIVREQPMFLPAFSDNPLY